MFFFATQPSKEKNMNNNEIENNKNDEITIKTTDTKKTEYKKSNDKIDGVDIPEDANY
jgi:hypothetical protein